MNHIINGRRYKVVHTDKIPDDKLGVLCGICDPPEAKGKTIYVRNGLTTNLLIDTLIHEALHAGLWCLSEEAVDTLATDITRMLVRELNIET